MADHYKEVSKKGYGSRITDSIKGIGIGLLLFLGSFAVLWNNEGRADLSETAGKAVEIDAAQVAEVEDGTLVAASGTLITGETLGDGVYLKDGDYLAISRAVEMYAWVEKTSSKSDTNLGGSETTETTYDYVMEWTSNPTASSSFRYPEGHSNPSLSLDNYNAIVGSATVGMYNVDPGKLSLPSKSPLTLNEEVLTLSGNAYIQGKYVYVPAAVSAFAVPTTTTTTTSGGFFDEAPAATTTTTTTTSDGFFDDVPATTNTATNTVTETTNAATAVALGDMRVSYSVLKNNVKGIAYGKLDGDQITPFIDKDNDNAKLYRFFSGSSDEAVATLSGEHKTTMWIWRIVGFMMMWMGLSSLFGPISVILDVVPFFGSLSRAAVGVVTLVSSIILSIVTIVVAMIAHNIIALILTIVLGAMIFIFFIKKEGEKGPKPPVAA